MIDILDEQLVTQTLTTHSYAISKYKQIELMIYKFSMEN